MATDSQTRALHTTSRTAFLPAPYAEARDTHRTRARHGPPGRPRRNDAPAGRAPRGRARGSPATRPATLGRRSVDGAARCGRLLDTSLKRHGGGGAVTPSGGERLRPPDVKPLRVVDAVLAQQPDRLGVR